MIALLAIAVAVPSPRPPVVSVTAPRVCVAAGGRTEASLEVRIADGYRIQANPAAAPFLVPVRVELGSADGVEVGTPAYPRGEPYELRGSDLTLSVLRGEVVIRVPLEARRVEGLPAAGAEIALQGLLHYQACDAHVCLRPASTPVQVRVRLAPRRVGAREPAAGTDEGCSPAAP